MSAVIMLCMSCGLANRHDDKMVFRYNESNAISTLDPAFASDLETMWLVNQLYDGLVSMDDSLHVVPSIARSWKISDDGLVYEFYLRPNVFFSFQ